MTVLTEKELTLFTPYRITSADTDISARLRLGAMVNLLIQSAIGSADKLGFGFGDLSQLHLFWVLRNLTVESYRPVRWSEELVVETWPKNIDGILYLRDFVVRDRMGEVVARATSGWLAVDRTTKRPKRFNSEQLEYFTHLKEKHSLSYSPERLGEVSGNDEFFVKPTFFDIDLNRHVTSTRYIDWMVDTLPIDLLLGSHPVKLSINYLKETMLGDSIRLVRRSSQPNVFEFEGINQGAGTSAFRGTIEYTSM
jgi:medium-chain acyl-[acyl-carrier-protein] hydrolase